MPNYEINYLHHDGSLACKFEAQCEDDNQAKILAHAMKDHGLRLGRPFDKAWHNGEALGLPLGLPQCAPPAAAPPFLSKETATIAHTSTAPSKPKQSAYPISVAWARML